MASFSDGADQGNAQFNAVVSALQGLAQNQTAAPGTAASNDTLEASRLSSLLNSQVNGVIRTPWLMSTTAWLAGTPPKGIVLGLNPSDVSWSMPQRMAITKNLGGTVTHAWPNAVRTTYYDEPRLTLNMQSGSLIPVAQTRKTDSVVVDKTTGKTFKYDNTHMAVTRWDPSPGITSFYAFLQLLDQPIIAEVPQAGGGKAWRSNLVTISYSSNLFPALSLIGRFDPKGITFTDSSSDPNKVTSWSAEFIVFDSFPRLSDNTGLSTFREDLLKRYVSDRITNNTQMQPR